MSKRIALFLSGYFLVAATAHSLLSTSGALAMGVTPNSIELEDSGNARSAVLKIYNSDDYPLAIELGIRRIAIGESGELSTLESGGPLTVFPPQAVIPPGATQAVQVIWNGQNPLQKSRTYFIDVNQVPVEMPSDTSGYRLLTNVRVIANVAPADAQARLSVENVELSNVERLPQHLRRRLPADTAVALLTVANAGNRHARLSDGELRLSAGDWSRTFSPDDLFGVLGLAIIQPGNRRQFAIPVDDPPPAGSVQARYSVQ